MPIFYKHVKGCGTQLTGTSPNQSIANWYWMEWGDPSSVTADTTYLHAPKIYYHNTNSTPQRSSLGYILTSGAKGQTITEDIKFSKQIKFTSTDYFIQASNSVLKIQYNANSYIQYLTNTGTSTTYEIDIKSNDIKLQGAVETSLGRVILLYASGASESANDADFKVSGFSYFAKAVNFAGKCQALYFNATSDRRAKINVKDANFNALHIVNSLHIKDFQYKSDNSNSIGLIAQDVANYNIGDFSLVDNQEASGQNGDYMTLKESKLVYILWKAIQEQQKEIEELKEQLSRK